MAVVPTPAPDIFSEFTRRHILARLALGSTASAPGFAVAAPAISADMGSARLAWPPHGSTRLRSPGSSQPGPEGSFHFLIPFLVRDPGIRRAGLVSDRGLAVAPRGLAEC